jgi:thioredoxin reductase (NADPH)
MVRRLVDVVVVGGAFAGLGGALTLARARRSVVVVDDGKPRNAPAAHSHTYLSRVGVSPLEILTIGRAEVAKYGVLTIDGQVEILERLPGGTFRVAIAGGGEWEARRLLAATGLVDELPEVPGLRERWGRDVVHCPFCFGWEMREKPLGVLATGPHAVAQALMWRQWSRDLILFQHTEPAFTEEQTIQLAARGIRVVEGEVVAVEVTDDHLSGVRIGSGQVIDRAYLVLSPRLSARHALLEPLGAAVAEHPLAIGSQVQADSTGRAAPGVWVAGNLVDVTAGVIQAAASGVTAGAAINADLTAEDVSRAVEATSCAGPTDRE